MKEYTVTITEVLEKKIIVPALNREEAKKEAEICWRKGEYILDADNFTGVYFRADNREQETDQYEER